MLSEDKSSPWKILKKLNFSTSTSLWPKPLLLPISLLGNIIFKLFHSLVSTSFVSLSLSHSLWCCKWAKCDPCFLFKVFLLFFMCIHSFMNYGNIFIFISFHYIFLYEVKKHIHLDWCDQQRWHHLCTPQLLLFRL